MAKQIKAKILVAEDIDSQNISNAQGGSINAVINPQIAFRLPFVPTAFSFAVMIMVVGMKADNDYKVSIKVVNPINNDLLYDSGLNPVRFQNVTDNFNFNLHLKNIPFYNQGDYKVVFQIDELTFEETFEIIANEELNVATDR